MLLPWLALGGCQGKNQNHQSTNNFSISSSISSSSSSSGGSSDGSSRSIKGRGAH